MLNYCENIILQWVSCLCKCSVKDMDELKDGQVYYKLIKEVSTCHYRIKSHIQESVLQFLQDEYPKFVAKDNDTALEWLCNALLLLCRLSLEPIFHKNLDINLEQDMKIKIQIISGFINSFGKDITRQDFSDVLRLINHMDLKSFSQISMCKLHNSNDVIIQQSKELKNLKIEIDTLLYEKSDLIKDFKAQQNELETLKMSLQSATSELKSICNTTCEPNNDIHYYKSVDTKSIESCYEKEIISLENYVMELQTVNYQLKEENHSLINNVKYFKEKFRKINKKNFCTEEIVVSVLLEIEKNQSELNYLKMEYHDLCEYLKEKSKTCIGNRNSYLHDDTLFNSSLSASETLSSVIEVQLMDAKKEIIILQNLLKKISTLLTIIIEEYEKLKLSSNYFLTKIITIKRELPNSINKTDCVHTKYTSSESAPLNFKLNINIGQYMDCSKYCKENNISEFLNILNKLNEYKKPKKYKKYLRLQSFKRLSRALLASETCLQNCNIMEHWSMYSNLVKIIAVNEDCKIIDCVNFNNLNFNNCSIFFNLRLLEFKNSDYNTMLHIYYILLNIIFHNSKIIMREVETKQNVEKTFLDIHKFTNYILCPVTNKKRTVILSIAIKNIIYSNYMSCMSPNRSIYLNTLQKTWLSINYNVFHFYKIYKFIIIMQQNMFDFSYLLGEVMSYSCTKICLRQLFRIKYKIQNAIGEIYSDIVQICSMNFFSAVEFILMLNSSFVYSMKNVHRETEQNKYQRIFLINAVYNYTLGENNQDNIRYKNYVINKIVIIKRRIDQFHYFIKIWKIYEMSECLFTVMFSNKSSKSILNSKRRRKLESNIKFIDFVNKNVYSLLELQRFNLRKKACTYFDRHTQKIHQKYELKLEELKDKMKNLYKCQIEAMKQDQELILMKQLEILQEKIEHQCWKHAKELKKYKKHISELTTQLWNIGEKLIVEKQKKEDFIQKLNILKMKYESVKTQTSRLKNVHLKKSVHSDFKYDIKTIHSSKSENIRLINTVPDFAQFEMTESIFRSEDEEGEIFDTTYLSETCKFQEDTFKNNLKRLSTLQKRNLKCKPHLKSSYPTDLEFLPTSVTEDEIKSGYFPEESFNNTSSQNLLNIEKIKGEDLAEKNTDIQRRSLRISSIFRKHRYMADRK